MGLLLCSFLLAFLCLKWTAATSDALKWLLLTVQPYSTLPPLPRTRCPAQPSARFVLIQSIVHTCNRMIGSFLSVSLSFSISFLCRTRSIPQHCRLERGSGRAPGTICDLKLQPRNSFASSLASNFNLQPGRGYSLG